MRINYNFAFKNSKLREWHRPAPPNLLISDVSLQKKIQYLIDQLKNNSELIYPPAFVLAISLGIQILNIYPTLIIKSLESQHNEYSNISRKLADLKSQKLRIKKNVDSIDQYFSQATLSYLFAFYLQNSVPEGVQLNSYSFNDNSFDIYASAYTIDSFNELLTLIIESPIINKDSVTLNQLSSKDSSQNINSKSETNFDIEIFGQVLKIDNKKRENLYKESEADGLLQKLNRFNNLKLLLKS
jgi:hypothetical protein